MALVVIPPDPLVSLEEVKVALGETSDDRNDLIEGLLMAAQSELDGPNGWVGISVAQQMVQITAPGFSHPAIRLPGPPIISATVLYIDDNGDEQTLDDATYTVASDGTLTTVGDAEWPPLTSRSDAVTVAYQVGIDDPDDPRWQQMRTAIMLHVRMTLDGYDPAVSRRAIESLVRSMWVPVA